MIPKSPRIRHYIPSPTGCQRGGRLNSELSVGVFVPWQHTHFLKLQGLENMFRRKNSRFFVSAVVYISKYSLFLTQIAV